MEQEPKSRRIEKFAFNLGDKIIVNEVQRPGMVQALIIDYLGPQYQVAYWDNGERKTVCLKEEEISLR